MTAFPARLTDAEWAVLEPLIPANRPGGRPPKWTRRQVLDAIVYVVRQGVTWRALPEGFPHWNTAFWYFQEWQKDGTWTRVEGALRQAVRLAEGRASATPSAWAAQTKRHRRFWAAIAWRTNSASVRSDARQVRLPPLRLT